MSSKPSNIEAIYPLAPMQEGILFHTLYNPDSLGYFEQYSYKLHGVIEVKAFKRAWQLILDRHPILRTLFTWEKRDKPLQIVRQKVTLPFDYQDWRNRSIKTQATDLDAFLVKDRQRGFTLSQAPLMRLALFCLADGEYQFTWSFHHLLLDGWSGPLIFAELFTIYQALCRHERPQLPPAKPYRDYITWLQKQDHTVAEIYWRKNLAGFTVPTPFGVDQAATDAENGVYAKQEMILPAAIVSQLQQIVQTHHLTMNTLIQGVWAILLSRYSGECDVVYGSAVSGRSADMNGIEKMVGIFINTLPMRVQVVPTKPLIDWLQALQIEQTTTRQFEYTALAQIQQWCDLPTSDRLFESILAVGNYPVSDQNSNEQPFTIGDVQVFEQTDYPLTLQVMPGEKMLWRLQYDCARFSKATISRMLGHLQTLFQGIAANPACKVGGLPLLTPIEREQLLAGWNPPSPVASTPQSITTLFEAQVARTPGHIAVSFRGKSLTYQQLNQRSNQLAHHLRQSGLQTEDLVALYLDRTIDMVVSILAVLKAGGAYLPLDAAYPTDRLAFMLQDSGASRLITQASMQANLPVFVGDIICVDHDWLTIEATSQQNLAIDIQPENLAYVIYTSGSTGKPKGVLVTHYNVVRLFNQTDSWFDFNDHDVWTLFHSYAFDFSVWELWGALLYGGRLVVVPYVVSRTFDEFYQLLVDEQVTVLNQTPSAFRQLIQAEAAVGVSPDLALRVIIFGGEALELQRLRPWFERHGDAKPQLVNMYGITETTIHVTYRPLTVGDLETAFGSVIGLPIPDLQLYILDQNHQPVPVGVTGEMYIGGGGVARGYLNRPELTAERFISHPFEAEAKTPLYRTGDLARFLENRDIEYLGRIDQQVKIRGFRIELEEIEITLNQHPAIRESVVIAQDVGNSGEPALLAYLVSNQTTFNIDDLRAYLKQSLPEYMVPAAFVTLNQLPLTPNGKLDYKALPKLDTARPAMAKSYVAPTNEIETAITQIWQAVLGLEQVGVHDNFFDLGGHSLRMVQVYNKLKAHFEQDLAMIKLFEYPTVAAMAQFFAKPQNGHDTSAQPQFEGVQDRANRQKTARNKQRPTRNPRGNLR